MALSKADMLAELKVWLAEMTTELVAAGVRIDQFTISDDWLKLKADYIRPGHKYIKDIFSTQYKDVRMIRRLLPMELWNRYSSWGDFSEHRESILLKEKHVELRRVMISRARPDILKKGKRNEIFKKLNRKKTGANGPKNRTDGDGSKSG